MLGALVSWLFDPTGLTPHGFCLLWKPGLLWLHALSDFGIGLAYLSVPFVLLAIIRLRSDLLYRPLFALFAAFILLCGVGHWLELLTLWVPAYGLEGIVKAATAITSIVTGIVLWKLMPEVLKWPSPAQFREVSSNLLEVRRAERRMTSIANEAFEARDELARDMSRREAGEKQARADEARYRILAETLREVNEHLTVVTNRGGIGIWDWDIPNDNMIWDAWMYRLYGTEPRDDVQAYDIWRRHLHPDDRQAVEQAVRDTLERDKPFDITFRVVWSDGSAHHIHAVASRMIRDETDHIMRIVGTSADTSQRQSDAEQREIILEASPNGTMIVDETGLITLANAKLEEIFGYPRGVLVGQSVEILVPEGFRARHGAMRLQFVSGSDRAMAAGRVFAGRKRDGSEVSVEVLLKPVNTPYGRITVASVFDVTERQRIDAEKQDIELRERLAVEATNASLDKLSRHLTQARNRAERANRAKSRFLAGMSHELRTPLNGILGYARLLHIEGGLNPAQSARVDAMLGAGKHLLEMITCVLDLSEIEAEHVTLRAVKTDVQAIAAASLDLVRPAAEAKALALTLAVSPGTPRELVADPTRLRQVLLNLLGNAVKFTAQGAVELRLLCAPDGSKLRIEVRDTGQGIPAEQRQRLFQTFERLDTEATHQAEGAGLGLALSARLAVLMEGRLGHEDNPDGGSVFWLELPLNMSATLCSVPVGPDDILKSEPVDIGILHVLVVDDAPMNRDIAASFLRAAGHIVTCVEGGAEAVAAVRSADFDVVLMDVRMPEVDGLQATRRIRALDSPRGRVPIVALTAQAFTDQITECRKAGMDGHLAKPYDPDTLTASITRALVTAGRRPDVEVSAAHAAAAIVPDAVVSLDPELPIFSPSAFDRTVGFLTPETVATYMRTIAMLGTTLLSELRAPDASARNDELAKAAHQLVGCAGMFGFERLTAIGREFERAAQTGASVAPTLADALCIAIEASLDEVTRINRIQH